LPNRTTKYTALGVAIRIQTDLLESLLYSPRQLGGYPENWTIIALIPLRPVVNMIEIASLVVAIISAFTGANSVFQSWRANRDAKKALSQSLEIGPPHVRDEYNRHLDRLGDRFARGDRERLSDPVVSTFLMSF
jgi:hypothetical protein